MFNAKPRTYLVRRAKGGEGPYIVLLGGGGLIPLQSPPIYTYMHHKKSGTKNNVKHFTITLFFKEQPSWYIVDVYGVIFLHAVYIQDK